MSMGIRTLQSLMDATRTMHVSLIEIDNGNGDKYTSWEFMCEVCNAFDTHLTDAEVISRLEDHVATMYTNVGCPVTVHHVEPGRLFVTLPTKSTVVGTIVVEPFDDVALVVRLDDERQTLVRLYAKLEVCPDLV